MNIESLEITGFRAFEQAIFNLNPAMLNLVLRLNFRCLLNRLERKYKFQPNF
ncbi:hypothetical protein [Cylindrospermopsis raciborskii]|uniref:hypothetical protein n=1 Tax=Cylindrospermopsis raciborskii TaxID=77022 RepID=UPI0038D15B6D